MIIKEGLELIGEMTFTDDDGVNEIKLKECWFHNVYKDYIKEAKKQAVEEERERIKKELNYEYNNGYLVKKILNQKYDK